jgi:hypothetical protein
MTAMCEPVSTIDLVTVANGTVDQHWQRPGESWEPVCSDCTDTGCPRLESAEVYLAQVRTRALS